MDPRTFFNSMDADRLRGISSRSLDMGRLWQVCEELRWLKVEGGLEIGAFYGRSSVFFGSALQMVWSVDVSLQKCREAAKLTREAGLSNCEFVCGDTLVVLPNLLHLPFQFACVDGHHCYKHTAFEVAAIQQKFKRDGGGILMLDDVDRIHVDDQQCGSLGGVPRTVKEFGITTTAYGWGFWSCGRFSEFQPPE